MTTKRFASGSFELLSVIVAASGSILFLYREFFLSRFDLITGDPGDARMYIALLEHWRAVFSGHAAFASPNFFAPQTGVLGYSDCLFLYVPEFLIFRLLGCDRYLAFEFTLIAVRLIGFFALYLLLRRKLRLDPFPSLAGACLFSISHIYYYSAGHPQLAAVAFVPVLALLLFHYFELPERRAWSLWSAAVLFGLLFFTGYYIAFFCALGCMTIFASWVILEMAGDRAGLSRMLRLRAPRLARDFGIALAVFGVALAPFLYVYLPVLRGTGGRVFAEIEGFVHSFREVFNVSDTNVVWGRLMARVYDWPMYRMGETNRGFTPVSVIVAIAIGCLSLRAWRNRRLRNCSLLTGVSCAVLYGLSVSFFTWIPWWFVYEFVPGAGAIRVPNRINQVIALGIAVLCAIALQCLTAWAQKFDSGLRAAAVAASVALAVFLLIEQADSSGQARISRAQEHRLFGQVPAPPSACRNFFLVNPRIPEPPVVGQVDAMLIAREKNLPTVDGYSGWRAPGWKLDSAGGDAAVKAEAYAEEHGVSAGLCQFDERANQWSLAPILKNAR